MYRTLFPLLGIAVALYALYVEHRNAQAAAAGEDYEALCDIKGVGSCSQVLMSEYGHILSKWKLVPAGSALDLPNPVLGIAYYLLVLLWPQHLSRGAVVAAAATASLAFSAYLASILAFELKDFCMVCVASYVVNACIFALEVVLVTPPAQKRPGGIAAGKGE
jgi:vitamin-K-epoxide reductase (warfarin-sensitive)